MEAEYRHLISEIVPAGSNLMLVCAQVSRSGRPGLVGRLLIYWLNGLLVGWSAAES